MSCERLRACPFYNDKMPIDKGLGAVYRKTYCDGDGTNCARGMVASKLGGPAVPIDLYPNMMSRAEEILAGAGK